MANPYIVGSKLSAEEVRLCVGYLVWFHPYADIFKEMSPSSQALRPILTQIERRMYFDMDRWAVFHLMEFGKYNLNNEFRPYINHVAYYLDAVLRIPRGPRSKMIVESEITDFQGELDCMFACPQHVAPRKFVERYGVAKPLQVPDSNVPYEDECRNRIARKKHCVGCRSELRHIWTSSEQFLFRYAMEYAAKFGKPRAQYADIFIARMVYHLVWRAYDLNLKAWIIQKQITLKSKSLRMQREEGEEFYKKSIHDANKRRQGLYINIKSYLAQLVLRELKENPLRIDRRGLHKK